MCERLSASSAGLGVAEARRRLLAIGPNELGHVHRVSPWSVLLAQFQNLLILILLIATAVSAYLGEVVEVIFAKTGSAVVSCQESTKRPNTESIFAGLRSLS